MNQGRLALLLLLSVAIVLLGRVYLWDVCRLSSDAMEPGLPAGAHLLLRRVGPVQAGDVVVVQLGDDDRFVKRVVAGPGSVVEVVDGRVLVDGEPLAADGGEAASVRWACQPQAVVLAWERASGGVASHRRWQVVTGGAGSAPLALDAGQYFVASDDRLHGRDSRQWGAVGREEIDGVVLAVLPYVDACEGTLDLGRWLLR